ncbi:hypothetical protein N7499_010382 [Penicillium canescens]|nr:hypothetical protein N7499_010382 [Penicillium canescens]KAJ6183451.1 hypothetical protein N7485_002093 [Penicillium canescens]
MLKRNAQGPQGSKDGDGGFGMSTPDDKPSRATAAQMASRKIKDVRKRRAPTPSGGASDTASFNPFASAAPAAPAPPSAGFTFGQSQSFPGASSTPAPNQGGMFSSGANGQSGFSFGSNPTSFGSPPPSNPFSVNTSFGGNSQPSTNGFSFGGFNAGGQASQSFPGFGAQQNTSTPTKPGMFGQQTAQGTASPADDSMQTSPDAKPKSMFASQPAVGGTPPTNPFANLSGQGVSNPFAPPKATTTDQTASKSAEAPAFKPLFGATPAASKPSEGDKDKPAVNIFAPKTTTTDETASKPAEAPAFKPLFGATPAASKPSEGDKDKPAVNIFAPKTTTTVETASKPAETSPFKPLFGAAASNPSEGEKEKPAVSNPFANLSTQASNNTNLFGAKTPTEETPAKPAEATKPFGSLFGSTTASKPSEPAGNLFAPKPAGDGSAPSNPFANLSGQSSLSNLSSPKVTGSEESAGKSAAATPFKSLFGAPAASKPAEAEKEQTSQPAFGNLFAPKPAADNAAAKPAEETPFKPMFGVSATPKPSEAEKEKPATSGIFAPKSTDGEQTPAKPAAVQPFGSLFGASPALSKPADEQTTPAKPSNPFANLSGQTPAGNPFAPKPVTTEQNEQTAKKPETTPFKSLFGSNAVSKPAEKEQSGADNNVTVNGEKKALNNLASPVKQSANSLTSSSFAPSSVTASGVPSSHSKANASTSSLPGTSASTSSSSPNILPPDILSATLDFSNPDSLLPRPNIPVTFDLPDLDENMPSGIKDSEWDRKSVNKLVFCRYLTESFKAEIAKIDPQTDCPDDIIMLYAEMRRQMGVPIGSSELIEHEIIFGTMRPNPDYVEDAAPATATTAPKASAPVTATAARPTASVAPAASPQPVKGDTSNTVNAFARSFSSPAPAPVSAATGSSVTSSASAATFPAPATTSSTTPAIFASASGLAPTPATPSLFAAPSSTRSSLAPSSSDSQKPTSMPSAPKIDGSGFRPSAQAIADAQKTKGKAEESDSSDSEDEEQAALRAKLAAAPKMRTVYVPGQGFKNVPDDDSASAPAPAAPAPAASPAPASSLFGAAAKPAASSSLFGAPSTGANSSESSLASTPAAASPAPTSSLFGTAANPPASSSLFGVPASRSSSAGSSVFGTAPPMTSSTSSIFDGSTQPVPATQNIFGGLKPTSPKRKASADDSDSEDDSPAKKSKPSPPSAPTSGSLFGRVSTPTPSATGQNFTWQPNTPIQFGNSQPANGQNSETTAAAPATSSAPAASPAPTSSLFGAPAMATPSAPTSSLFGGPAAATPSAASQPATATVDGSADDEEGEPGEIFDLAQSNGGEEEETVVFEEKCRAFKLTTGWTSQANGPVRLLKHPVTGRARIVVRAEPSGNVVLNTLLKKELVYSMTTNSVQLMVPVEGGTASQWAIRVKREKLNEFFNLVQEIKN